MNRKFGLLLPFVLFLTCGQAQNDEKQVSAVIETLFMAMEKGDSVLARTVFASEVTLATIASKADGTPALIRESGVDKFVTAVGTPHPKIWYEEIWNLSVKVDGSFAQAWCDYAFYLDHEFSHCGADAFHLFKDQQGWKIFHLADTRRKTNCQVPEHIKQKHGSK